VSSTVQGHEQALGRALARLPDLFLIFSPANSGRPPPPSFILPLRTPYPYRYFDVVVVFLLSLTLDTVLRNGRPTYYFNSSICFVPGFKFLCDYYTHPFFSRHFVVCTPNLVPVLDAVMTLWAGHPPRGRLTLCRCARYLCLREYLARYATNIILWDVKRCDATGK
jgi:hypothetical protein